MKLTILLSIIFCFTCCISQLEDSLETDIKNDNIFSVKNVISNSNPNFGPGLARFHNETKVINIKRSTEISYSIDKETEETDLKSADTTISEYDINGNQTSYMSIRNWCFKFTYLYDNQGRNIKKTSSNCDGKIDKELETIYNDSIIVESLTGNSQNKIVYTLDKFGNKIKRQDYNGGPNVTTHWTKEYDDNKNVTDFKFYIYDSLEFHESYKFGEEHELISSTVIKFPDNLTSVYDFNGNQIVSYDDARSLSFEYNESNNTIIESRNYDSKDPDQIIYRYDDFGNILEIVTIINNLKETRTSFTYHYDKYGNIIERQSFWKGELRSVSNYSYEYYK